MAQALAQVDNAEYTTDTIIAALDDTIAKYRISLRQLKEILGSVQNLERGVNVAKTLSTTANTLGQALLFTPEILLGIGLIIGGGLLSLGTSITNTAITKVNIDELVKSLKRADESFENLQPSLIFLHILGNGLGCPISQRTEDIIYSLLDKRVFSAFSGEIASKGGPLLTKIAKKAAEAAKKAPEAARAAKMARALDTLQRYEAARCANTVQTANTIRTVDAARTVEAVKIAKVTGVVNNLKTASEVELVRLRDYYSTIISTTGAEAPSLMATAGKVFAVAGVAVDIGSTVYGWAKKHPPVERVEKEIRSVKKLLKHLRD